MGEGGHLLQIMYLLKSAVPLNKSKGLLVFNGVKAIY